MRALVTGATGFLGLYIVEQLVARGDEVRAFCRRPTAELQATGVEIVAGDIRHADDVLHACRDIDVAFHTAAVAAIWGPWKLFYETNTLGTQHVIRACLANRVAKLVFTSSPSVTFDGRDQCGVDESVPYARRWLAHYAHTKALAEQAVLAANRQGSLLTCALRPHLIWGPRDRHLVPRLLNRQRAGQLRRIGDGTNLIDTVYVEDAAVAHLQAADALEPDSPVCGQPYFISQGQPVNCWNWINELLAVAGLSPVRGSIPFALAYSAGAVLEGLYRLSGRSDEPRMTRFLAAQLARSHYFDIARAQNHFGYSPQISTIEGLGRLRDWLNRQPAPSPV